MTTRITQINEEDDRSFLDDESASLLCRLKRLPGVELEGAHLFIMEVIAQAERHGGA